MSASSNPLRRWRVRNFKSIAEAEVDLAPLTVLMGANSTGKSSFIQSILLAAQAAAAPSNDAAVPLNGPLVQLGELAELRRVGARRGDVVALGATVGRDRRHRTGGGDLEWDLEMVPPARSAGGGTGRLRRLRLEGPTDVGGRVELVADRWPRRPIERARVSGLGSRGVMVPLAGQLSWTGAGEGTGAARTVGLTLRGGVPETVFARSDRTEVAVDGWLRRVRQAFSERRRPSGPGAGAPAAVPGAADRLAEEAVDRLAPMIAAAIRAAETDENRSGTEIARVFGVFEELRRDATQRAYWRELAALATSDRLAGQVSAAVGRGSAVARPAADDPEIADAVRQLEAAGADVAGLLSERVLHLGPLRQDPQVLHQGEPTGRLGSVGTRGEYAFAVLHRHADREISCPLADGSLEVVPLRAAVEHWLEALGLATAVETTSRGQLGIEARVAVPGGPTGLGLTAVGVGVSQVLPVLVMALAAEPGSVLLLEQPELHLHPAVQQRLGDFLLACAASGRQVVVETHSDHLVTRLRRRIAEDREDTLVDSVALVVAERPDGSTRFRRLATNRYGGLDEWPEGFFDEGALDSRELLRAGLRKRSEGS
jgi:predicted ATPase